MRRQSRAFDCFWRSAPLKEFPVFMAPVAHHQRVREPARQQGPSPGTSHPKHGALNLPRHSRTRQPALNAV
jgi:hypothetical protein